MLLYCEQLALTTGRLQALRVAALCGAVSVVQLLLEAGADDRMKDCMGQTPLSLAVLLGQWECAEALVLSPGGAAALQVSACLTCFLLYSHLAGVPDSLSESLPCLLVSRASTSIQ